MVIYEENTKRIVIPSGLGNLTGLMEAEAQAMYNSGRTDGYAEGIVEGMSIQDRKLTDSVTFNENGEYDADYGYKKVIVDVDNQWDEGFEVGYESGFTDGYASATSRLVTFRFETYKLLGGGGPSAITVNGVPSEYFEHSEWYGADPSFVEISAHTGDNFILSAELVINLFGGAYESIWPQEWDAVYVNGDKTEPISQTKNVDGDYVIYNFTFNPCGSSSAITEAYESGYTDGYASGYTDGYASGYTDGQTGYELGTYVSTPMPNDLYGTIYTKSFNDEPHSPEIVGWGALHMDLGQIIYYGKNEQKALMTSGTIVSNGTYTMEDGWNKIVVDVPQGESKGPLYSIFLSFAGHPTLSSLPTDWKVNGFDFIVTSGYTNIQSYTTIGVDGYLDSAISLITPNVITFKVPTTDYEQWSESVSANSCRVNGAITYQTSAYDGGFYQHVTGWAGTPDADDPSKTIITINIGQ